MLRAFLLFGAFLTMAGAADQSPASRVWLELKEKREKLASLHQEFEVTQLFKRASGGQSMKRQVVLDMSQRLWREKSVSGSGTHVRIFDGNDTLWMEEGGSEFVRTKYRSKDDDPLPSPYDLGKAEWGKAVEIGRRPCGLSGSDHTCVVLEVPLNLWVKNTGTAGVSKMTGGITRLSIDTETGAVLASRTVQLIENDRGAYQSDATYVLKRIVAGAPPDAGLFKLPAADMKEVKELARWNAAKIKKQLAGKPAPELSVIDIQGKPITLAACKGKTVLLDFFTTWCPPCRADGPSLDKLHQKHGARDLVIIGISVSEERAVVEKFLKEHPHRYPIVLTSENEMPRPYQISLFPTYIIIGPDGNLTAAVEDRQGFGELRRLLKKAGMDVN